MVSLYLPFILSRLFTLFTVQAGIFSKCISGQITHTTSPPPSCSTHNPLIASHRFQGNDETWPGPCPPTTYILTFTALCLFFSCLKHCFFLLVSCRFHHQNLSSGNSGSVPTFFIIVSPIPWRLIHCSQMNDSAYLVNSDPCSLMGKSPSQNSVGIQSIRSVSGLPSLDLRATQLKDRVSGHVDALLMKTCQTSFQNGILSLDSEYESKKKKPFEELGKVCDALCCSKIS